MDTRTDEKRWIPDTAQFGARLALVRWQMGWNLKEASLACGFAQNSWSGWEAGGRPRDYIDTVDKIVKRTGVNRMWLMMGEGGPSDYKAVVSDIQERKRTARRPGTRMDSRAPKGRAA